LEESGAAGDGFVDLWHVAVLKNSLREGKEVCWRRARK
jgi:hypothetical protein